MRLKDIIQEGYDTFAGFVPSWEYKHLFEKPSADADCTFIIEVCVLSPIHFLICFFRESGKRQRYGGPFPQQPSGSYKDTGWE